MHPVAPRPCSAFAPKPSPAGSTDSPVGCLSGGQSPKTPPKRVSNASPRGSSWERVELKLVPELELELGLGLGLELELEPELEPELELVLWAAGAKSLRKRRTRATPTPTKRTTSLAEGTGRQCLQLQCHRLRLHLCVSVPRHLKSLLHPRCVQVSRV